MATVYRATQVALGREVAVKLVPALGVEESLVARFKREARVASALEHPHAIPIYAAGEEDGLLYLVMRLVDGPDLGAFVAREGPLEPAKAVALIEQVAGALDAAHAAGLVHRDVKPANVLIEHGDHAYLSDFGLMRRVVGESAITGVGQWVGTMNYAAPEQIEGGPIDRRADVYSLAAVLYTALTGEPPFPRDNDAAVAWAHVNAEPPQVAGAGRLNAVIARGMAKNADDRYRTAGEFACAARAALPGTRIPSQRRQARSRAALIALPVLVAAAVGAVIASTGSNSTPRLQTFSGAAFSFSYPAGWRLVEAERRNAGFLRTEVASPDGTEVVIIDRSPGDNADPAVKASGIERLVAARTSGYRRVSFGRTRLAGHSAFVWKFLQTPQPPARIDVFEQLGGSGYAVLGEARTLDQVTPVALAVARSLKA
jgi:Protein kinase domain